MREKNSSGGAAWRAHAVLNTRGEDKRGIREERFESCTGKTNEDLCHGDGTKTARGFGDEDEVAVGEEIANR